MTYFLVILKQLQVSLLMYLEDLEIQIWFNLLFKIMSSVKYCGLRYNPDIFDST